MKVLITLADLEPAVRLNARLEALGLETALVAPYDDLNAALDREHPDAIVFSGGLVEQSTVQAARRQLWDGTGAAVIGLADVGDPILLERLKSAGFTELLVKPVDLDDVVAAVQRVLERRQLSISTGLIGESAAMREVLVKIEQMAPVSSTVLIEGESGTGKELVARAIHQLSPRRGKPFIAVHIGALPETLLESELFGHEKGAFTGAAERRVGRFELAHTGTLFLDEIGEAPLSTQVKLLRVLEQREMIRLGGTQPIRVDVRVVAATNRPLREAVEAGAFRADLYYRLNVLNIYLPPLRERREDIPLLVRRFIQEFARQHDRPFRGISAEAMRILMDYSWPGNVRELRNLIESMVVLAPGREIGPADIPPEYSEASGRYLPVHVAAPVVRGRDEASGRELEFIVRSLVELKLQVEELRRRLDEHGGGRAIGRGELVGEIRPSAGVADWVEAIEPNEPPVTAHSVVIGPGMTMAEIERAAIEAALQETRGNRRKAAQMLGIGERTLYRKLNEYHLVNTDT